jgi:hypothetical protein
MYARLQTVANRPADESLVPMIVDTIASHPGFAGLAMLGFDDGPAAWSASGRTGRTPSWPRSARPRPRSAPVRATPDEIYEVDADESGRAAGEEPSVAFLGEFDGPLSPARLEAARVAGSERIGPVLRTLPGLVRLLVLWHPTERRMVVLHLATS